MQQRKKGERTLMRESRCDKSTFISVTFASAFCLNLPSSIIASSSLISSSISPTSNRSASSSFAMKSVSAFAALLATGVPFPSDFAMSFEGPDESDPLFFIGEGLAEMDGLNFPRLRGGENNIGAGTSCPKN